MTALAGDPSAALFEGVVTHVRHRPRRHRVRQRTTMLWVDVDRAASVLDAHPAWSAGPGAVAQLRADDHLDGADEPLGPRVRSLVAQRTGEHPDGPVCLLTQPRTFGWGFNPLSVFVCFDAAGSWITHVVLEVTSTPWGERVHHVLRTADGEPTDGDGRRWSVAKDLHVSPFLPMDVRWDVRLRPVGEALSLRIDVVDPSGERVLDVALRLRRRPVDRRTLGRALRTPWTHPLAASAGIHWHALRLALKRVPVHAHPHGAPRRRLRHPVRVLAGDAPTHQGAPR